MNRFALYRLLHRNSKKDSRRSPAFEQSIMARVMMLFLGGIMIIYLIFIGVMLSIMSNESDMPGLLLVVLPIFLLFDFVFRFMFQQTPLVLAKPYFLLPIARKSVIEFFLLSNTLSGWNALWLSLFIPYIIIIVAGGTSFLTALALLIVGMLMVLCNSQWYLLVRTLISRSLYWWLLPLIVYALYFASLYFSKQCRFIDGILDSFSEQILTFHAILVILLLFVTLFFLNRYLQFCFIYEEIAQEQKATLPNQVVREFSYLGRFGLMGEYVNLELKSIMRNKAIRSKVLISLCLVSFLSSIIAFTDVYEGFMLLNFWCYYCFALYGMTSLVKIMGAEGNYIDLLMTQRKNILLLLRAKYYFHCVILAVPFFIMLPAVIIGRFSWLMMFSNVFLTSGLLYFILFQLAVYNKQTLPLNQKISGKTAMENGIQLIVEMMGMFAPIAIVSILLLIFKESMAYLVTMSIGLIFTLLHPLWLRHVYQRMMKRKYLNLEGFHASC